MRESDIVAHMLMALSRLPGVRVWRQNAGKVQTQQGYWYQGLPDGAADIGGIGPGGIVLQVECKTAKGTVRQAQLAWAEMIRKHGGVYYVAKPQKGEEMTSAVERMTREMETAIGVARTFEVNP